MGVMSAGTRGKTGHMAAVREVCEERISAFEVGLRSTLPGLTHRCHLGQNCSIYELEVLA